MTSPDSPFFDIPRAEWIASNRSAFAVWDAYPVDPGHALIVSRRQISDEWDAATGQNVNSRIRRPAGVRKAPLSVPQGINQEPPWPVAVAPNVSRE